MTVYDCDNGNNDRETNRKIKKKELRIRRIVNLKNKSDLMYTCKDRRTGLFVKEGFMNEKKSTLREKIIKIINPTVHRVYIKNNNVMAYYIKVSRYIIRIEIKKIYILK